MKLVAIVAIISTLGLAASVAAAQTDPRLTTAVVAKGRLTVPPEGIEW